MSKVINMLFLLPPEEVHKHFVLEGSRLYRKLGSGACTQLKSRDGNQIVTIFKNVRLLGADIAWCLIHGNWPKWPIAQIRSDPLDFAPNNLYPARVKRLRYVERQRGLLFMHSLSAVTHISAERCRAHWEELAREFYVRDLPYVLRVEAAERDLRTTYLRDVAHVQVQAGVLPYSRPVRGQRPPSVMDKEWHWYKDEWVCVPIACHVADDYRQRIEKQRRGAVRFAFNPATRMVQGFDQAGVEVL